MYINLIQSAILTLLYTQIECYETDINQIMSEISIDKQNRPKKLSQDLISKLNSTIDQVKGYFQIVQMHRKKQRFYSTHISDGFFKIKVIFKEQTSKQIDCGQIKLFSILYGTITNCGNRRYFAKEKLDYWDYHRTIGLIKPWKPQRPNINLEGSNIIRWSDTIQNNDKQKDQWQQQEQQNSDRRVQEQHIKIAMNNQQVRTQSIEIQKKQNNIDLMNNNTIHKEIDRHLIKQQNTDYQFFDNIINKGDCKNYQSQRQYTNTKNNNNSNNNTNSNNNSNINDSKQKLKKLLINSDDEEQQQIQQTDNKIIVITTISQNNKNKVQQQGQQDEDDKQLWETIQKIQNINNNNINNINNNNNNSSNSSNSDDDQLDNILQIIKNNKKQNKQPTLIAYQQNNNKQQQQSFQSSQADLIFQIIKNQTKSKQQQKIQSIFLQNQQIYINDIVPFSKYQQSWIYIQPITSKSYIQQNINYILIICKTKSANIINLYLTNTQSSTIDHQFIFGNTYKLSLKNINISQPKQPQHKTYFYLHTNSSQIQYIPTNNSNIISNIDTPYLPLHQINTIQVGTVINIAAIVKSTFSHTMKTKKLIKLNILDIYTKESVQFVVFSQNDYDIFDDHSNLCIKQLSELTNRVVIIYNTKITSYQGKKSLQYKANTKIIYQRQQIQKSGESNTANIKQYLQWIDQGNHVQDILSNQCQYDTVTCIRDLFCMPVSCLMFHLKRSKILSISPSFSYQACQKCHKKIFMTKNYEGTIKACQGCGPVTDSQIAYRYYISAQVGDSSGSIKVIWGHTDCKHIFKGTTKQCNQQLFREFKQKNLHQMVQIWLKLNSTDDKNIIGCNIYSVMKFKRIQVSITIKDNLKFIYRFLQQNR